MENKINHEFTLGLTGLDHPAIAARDVDQLANWYCEVLGYVKYFRHEKPVWILLAPDNSLLEIMPVDANPRPERTTWTPGWSHLALRVKNIHNAIEYLDSKNVEWGGEIINAVGGGQVRTFYDPEGNMLQLVERLIDEQTM
ncbi:glyoxylase I family protein [Pedobacter sp. AK017]|uniref:VOC family protein n=1 Tax=Pedobacter sp. AK017 TaxID=2723073 RepID=UPI00160B2B3E|nr:VOC family protein [Pedobacter sp. AK017]MBB5441199.1 glyoxylase I family protein [Pedobacter sp. AK017]